MSRLPLLNDGVGSYQGIGNTYVQSRLRGHSTYSFTMTAFEWSKGEDYVERLSPSGIRLPRVRYPNGHRRIDRRISVREAGTAGRTSLGSGLDRRQQLNPKCRRDLRTTVQIDRSGVSEWPGAGMQESFSRGGRPLGAEEIAMMRGLLREYCSQRRCDRQGDVAEEAARYLITLYQNGLGTEEELRRRLYEKRNWGGQLILVRPPTV